MDSLYIRITQLNTLKELYKEGGATVDMITTFMFEYDKTRMLNGVEWRSLDGQGGGR